MSKRPKVSVVIPTLNEEDTIGDVLRRIPKEYEVVIVDSSKDDTVEVVKRARLDAKILRVPPLGKGVALREGTSATSGDVIAFMDGDGSHDPSDIASMLEVLERERAAIVVASRMPPLGNSQEHSPLHYSGNKLVTMLINWFFGGRLTDSQNGFRITKREALERMKLDAPGFTVETQMSCRALRLGFKLLEVPSLERKRKGGLPKMSLLKYGWRHFPRILLELVKSTNYGR